MKRISLAIIMALVIGSLFSLPGYAQEAIQTQPSSDGNFEASLIGAKVKREVLTVKIKLKNIASKSNKMECTYKSVYYTDIKNKKKYFALKDSEGKYIAGPQDRGSNGGKVERYIDSGAQTIIWIKFPAPPETTDTIDIIIPGILPFEEIEIKR
jgi:hypothetical protein